ncbi:MAG: ABC transporter transmembrane domain-containing protein [Ilumatobacteraceae bacterium]
MVLRIGEGLIRDLRTQVFDHVQRMPISFFSRAQTGALVTRLDSDVQGAQQAFTSTLSNVVGNVVAVVTTLIAMTALSWQITLLALTLLPLFIFPTRWVGSRLASITRERYRLNWRAGTADDERLNVSGALVVKLFGRPEDESAAFVTPAGSPTSRSEPRCTRVVMTALSLTPPSRPRHRLRLGWRVRDPGSLQIGFVALTGASRPPVRTASPASERPGRRDDDPRQLER